jgi:hypothetical protein
VSSWSDRGLPPPPPSCRGRRLGEVGDEAAAVRLLHAINDVLSALGARSPADFRPLPFLWSDRRAALEAAFDGADPVPPALVVELAPLLAPRLERLAPRLRRRLGRERRRMPLSRIREMDPACVQRNSRRPGRNLIEKAGPRQQLHGVVRVPRFDTTENRVLLAASRQLAREADGLLREVPGERRGEGERSRALRMLVQASRQILARPELEGVGLPRPGERPSNAMLGDADYRAAWRAWQLLLREEARFADEWRQLEEGWRELLLLAAWAALERRDDLEPVAAWGRIRHDREAGRRVEPSGPRRWIQWTDGAPALIELEREADVLVLRRRLAGEVETWRLSAGLTVGAEPADDGGWRVSDDMVSREGAGLLAEELLSALPRGRPRSPTPPLVGGALVGLSLLEPRVRICADGQSQDGDCAAACSLEIPDEAPLFAVGRESTWRGDVAGPDALHRDRAALAGSIARQLAGLRDTAIAVPDAMPMLARAALRRRCGQVWLVPAPVAAVLSLGEALDPVHPAPFSVLVIVETAGTLDITVLERRPVGPEEEALEWVRSAPCHDSSGGLESRLGLSGAAVGAWLRAPGTRMGWALMEDGLDARDFSPSPSPIERVLREVLGAWRGDPPRCAVVASRGEGPGRALGAVRPELPVTALDTRCLAEGAWRFLDRHRVGLPTWRDRLPRLDLLVRKGRERVPVALVAADTLVAPGELIHHEPPERLVVGADEARVDFRMALDGRPESAVLRLAGHPLPLERPARVRISVRYVHGREGLSVTLLPIDEAVFQRLEFSLSAADERPPGTVEAPPAPSQAPAPPVAEDFAALLEAAGSLDQAWRSLNSNVQKQARNRAGEAKLQGPLKGLYRAAACLRASGPETLSPERRAALEEGPTAWLGWLLGVGRLKGAGRAPKLTTPEVQAAVQARAALRVRGRDGVAEALAIGAINVPEVERLQALGRLVDGRPDAVWEALVAAKARSAAEQGARALGIALALDGHPALGAALDDESCEALLTRCVADVGALARDERVQRFKREVFRLLLVPPRLCRLREHGRLPVGSPVVRAAIDALTDAREQLPAEVRSFAGRRALTREDEPIAVAIDHLAGHTGALPSTEDA